MSVLVTGAAGFLGSYVVAGLAAAGHPVQGYDLARPGAEALAIAPALADILTQGQITDAPKLLDLCRSHGVTTIVHIAALVGVDESLQQPMATYLTNVMGWVTICEAARQAGVGRGRAHLQQRCLSRRQGPRVDGDGCRVLHRAGATPPAITARRR